MKSFLFTAFDLFLYRYIIFQNMREICRQSQFLRVDLLCISIRARAAGGACLYPSAPMATADNTNRVRIIRSKGIVNAKQPYWNYIVHETFLQIGSFW